MSMCLGDRLDGPSWTGLPLGRFAPPPHDAPCTVAATQHTLFVWMDGASPAAVQSRRGSVHYRRGAGVMDLMACAEPARIAHDNPAAVGQALLVALPAKPPATERENGNGYSHGRGSGALTSRFGFHDSHLHDLALALRAHCVEGAPYGRIYTESLSLAISACVFAKYDDAADLRGRALPAGADLFHADAGGMSPQQRAAMVSYIEAHLANDLGLAELAAVAGYSRPHFVRLFKRAFALPPHRFVMRMRLERARQLLAHGDDSLAAIAAACGFSDVSHFGNCFARHAGESPGLFRRRQLRRWVAGGGAAAAPTAGAGPLAD